MEKMHIFTPGPVPIEEHLRALGEKQPPYNRTEEFSEFTREILSGLKYVFQTQGSVAMLTASGTAAMEASVLNFVDVTDKVLIINGGTFGQRWCDLCDVHSIAYDELKVPLGEDVALAQLNHLLEHGGYTALMINAHETSTGHLYDIQAIGQIAREFGVFFIVDAISTICADQFSMDDWHVDVAVLSSQKALALPPGLAFVAMNERAKARMTEIQPKSLYLNLADYLRNQQRGQLPYTPAIGLMIQLHQRLLDIQQMSLPSLIKQHQQRAEFFRQALDGPAFSILPARSSNAMTGLCCHGLDASRVVEDLRNRYGIVVAPSGGDLKSKLIRIAHMGDQNDEMVAHLIAAIKDIASFSTSSSSERVEV